MRSIGVDLHSNSLTACYLNEDKSEQLKTQSLKELQTFKESLLADDEVAVEATSNVRWFVEQIRPLVSRVVIVNPSQFEVIRKSVKKTDRHDARALAGVSLEGQDRGSDGKPVSDQAEAGRVAHDTDQQDSRATSSARG